MKNNWKNLLFVITAIVGVLVSLELVKIFYDANFVPDAQPSFCAINEKIDCDAVARSPYALFIGVPYAIWGLLFYIFVLFIAFVDKLAKIPFLKILEVFKNKQSYLYCLSLFAVVFSIGLAGLSSLVLQKACLLCYVTYILNGVLLFAMYDKKGAKHHILVSISDFIEGVSKPLNAVILSVVVILFSSLLVYANVNKTFVTYSPLDFKLEDKYKKAQFGNILGNPRARVIVHEYTDFQCPYCAISNAMMIRIAGELDNVLIMHHDYPLDAECNHYIRGSLHPKSCMMAKYSIASKHQGKYWDFNILLFENNRKITEEKVLELAKEVELDIEQLKKDAYSKEVEQELLSGITKARKMGISATPTVMIGVRKYEGIMPYFELKQILLNSGARLK